MELEKLRAKLELLKEMNIKAYKDREVELEFHQPEPDFGGLVDEDGLVEIPFVNN